MQLTLNPYIKIPYIILREKSRKNKKKSIYVTIRRKIFKLRTNGTETNHCSQIDHRTTLLLLIVTHRHRAPIVTIIEIGEKP